MSTLLQTHLETKQVANYPSFCVYVCSEHFQSLWVWQATALNQRPRLLSFLFIQCCHRHVGPCRQEELSCHCLSFAIQGITHRDPNGLVRMENHLHDWFCFAAISVLPIKSKCFIFGSKELLFSNCFIFQDPEKSLTCSRWSPLICHCSL